MTPSASSDRPAQPSVGLIVPCFDEEEVLPALFESLGPVLDRLGPEARVLLVNDGSRDGTADLLDAQCARDPRYGVLHLSRNFGHQAAITAGLQHVRGDVVVLLDADLQDPPDLVPAMIATWREGYDIVYGVRQKRKEAWVLRAAYRVFYRLLKRMANVDIPLDAGDFSLMDRRVVDLLNRMPEQNRFVRGLRGWVGFRQTGLPYERAERRAGAPKYNLPRLMRLALDGLVSFSIVPLRLAVWLGLATSLFGFLYLIYAVAERLLVGTTPPGWASLVVLILLLGGIQLVMIGIIGEYVGRIFEEVKGRPRFIVARESGWARDEGHG